MQFFLRTILIFLVVFIVRWNFIFIDGFIIGSSITTGSCKHYPACSSSSSRISSDLVDILNASDLQEIENRFSYLQTVFPRLEEDELKQLVRTSASGDT